MPFINSKVNISMSENQKKTLKERLGQAISIIPGKSESWLMVSFEDNVSLYFQGKDDSKIAWVEVKLFGHAEDSAYEKLTNVICDIYEEVLGIAQDKIYVKYEECSCWGWNGKNF